ncbi:MAG: F-type H+-transporting ATPase subunit b [Candidatus Omnitrophota bacterium]|jgi:F-type H+-transporting ATPase subunit b
MSKLTEIIEVSAGAQHHENDSVLSPDVTMLFLTWVTFFLLLAVLHKFAWKPILAALDKREESIRNAVEEAEHIKNELNELEAKRIELMNSADKKAKEIIVEARNAADEAARNIQVKAKEEAKILLENAQREISEETKKAQADLKETGASIAISLAAKLLKENLDNNKNAQLIAGYIKEI